MHPQLVTVVPQFDSDSSRYRCCCGGCCRITTCARIIGIVELIGVVINVIAAIAQYTVSPTAQHRAALISALISLVITAIVNGLLLYGVAKEKAPYLIPHLVMQIIAIVFMTVGIILCAIGASAAAAGEQTDQQYGRATVAVYVATAVGLFISNIIEIWFLVNIFRCYRYLKDKAIAERMVASLPQPTYAMAMAHQQPTPEQMQFQNEVFIGEPQYKPDRV